MTCGIHAPLQLAQQRGHVAVVALLQAPVQIPPGTPVVLQGLVGAADLNGRTGVVRSWASGRYTVEIAGARSWAASAHDKTHTGTAMPQKPQFARVKGENLSQQLAVQRIRRDAPEATAAVPMVGTVLELHGSSGASSVVYSVMTSGAPAGSEEAWPASEVVLPAGAVGRMVGLVGAAHLNGLWCRVTGTDLGAGRYTVEYREAAPESSSHGKPISFASTEVGFANVTL